MRGSGGSDPLTDPPVSHYSIPAEIQTARAAGPPREEVSNRRPVAMTAGASEWRALSMHSRGSAEGYCVPSFAQRALICC
ncbi:hypothetical protein RRG08_037866 [Elysia crispata]|uniref:Uncharacterized protein n=1 Tax=Elysia crispata TaxID=231223 RepID=A0AAE0ZJX9_9GAST|nr:hypothetical protein RRG08_037866 [Elysia crispata]